MLRYARFDIPISFRQLMLSRNGALQNLRGNGNMLLKQQSNIMSDRTSARRPQEKGATQQRHQKKEELSVTDMEEAENVEDWMVGKITKHDLTDEVKGEEKKRKQWLVRRILERKYFKPQPEINVLTWAAKEQMRYLNAEYPDEWTPELLAESFPVSIEGVRRILRSTFVPRTPSEIAEHDRRARSHHQVLLNGESGVNRGTSKTVRCTTLLKSAAGNELLPMPTLTSSSVEKNITRQLEPGTFVSLLPKNKQERVIISKTTETGLITESDSSKNTSRSAASLQKSHLKQRELSALNECSHSLTSANPPKPNNECSTFNARMGVSDAVGGSDIHKTVVGKRRSLRGKRDTPTGNGQYSFDREEYAIRGTEKITENQVDRENNVDQKARENEQLMKETRSNVALEFSQRQSPKVRYDDDIYVYDDIKGYQYPYGRHADLPAENANLFKGRSAKTRGSDEMAVHQRGNDYYDNDGEFLFRVP